MASGVAIAHEQITASRISADGERFGARLRRLGVSTSFAAELGWVAGRFVVITTCLAAVLLFRRELSSYHLVRGLIAAVYTYNTGFVLLLWPRRVWEVFAAGVLFDNFVVAFGWVAVTSSQVGLRALDARSPTALYLVIFPMVVMGVARMGRFLGAAESRPTVGVRENVRDTLVVSGLVPLYLRIYRNAPARTLGMTPGAFRAALMALDEARQ